MPQGFCKPFMVKALDLWHDNRELAEVVMTIDIGSLSNWRFNDMSPMTRWVSRRITPLT